MSVCPLFSGEKILVAFIPLAALAAAVWARSKKKEGQALFFLILSLILVWSGWQVNKKFHGMELTKRLPGISQTEVTYNTKQQKDVSQENTGFIVYSPTFLPDGFVKGDPFFWPQSLGTQKHVTQPISYINDTRAIIMIDSGAASSSPYKSFNRCVAENSGCVFLGEASGGGMIYKTYSREFIPIDMYYTQKGETYITIRIESAKAVSVLEPHMIEVIESLSPINLE